MATLLFGCITLTVLFCSLVLYKLIEILFMIGPEIKGTIASSSQLSHGLLNTFDQKYLSIQPLNSI